MIETIDNELAPLDGALSLYARHQPGLPGADRTAAHEADHSDVPLSATEP
jgi:hypothetical protein